MPFRSRLCNSSCNVFATCFNGASNTWSTSCTHAEAWHLGGRAGASSRIALACQRKQKADSTQRSSQAVRHPSTNRALRCLTSEVERDPVHSTRYGRRRILVWSRPTPIYMVSGRCCGGFLCARPVARRHPVGERKAPPAGLEPAIFGLEVRRLVH